MGYSEAHITRLENGQRLPDLTTVRTLLIPALGLDDEPRLTARLIELAESSRSAEDVAQVAARDSAYAKSPSNLPAQLTRFIGREREMAQVMRLLTATRLLTLTGSGGCGKTRRAVEVGAALAVASMPIFPDGVWLAELAPLADAALVPRTVAGVFQLTDDPGHTPAELLISFLGSRRLLLILDNCEHVIAACADLAEALLRDCPHLTILATSREALRVPGEVAWRVPSLSTLEPLRLPPSPRYAIDWTASRWRSKWPQPWMICSRCSAAASARHCRGSRPCVRRWTGASRS